jgi:hypothetical protein
VNEHNTCMLYSLSIPCLIHLVLQYKREHIYIYYIVYCGSGTRVDDLALTWVFTLASISLFSRLQELSCHILLFYSAPILFVVFLL